MTGHALSGATIQELLDWARGVLTPARTATLDAQLLLAHVLARPRSWLLAHGEERPAEGDIAGFRDLIDRRRHGEPVAYLRGHVEWWDLDLVVSPSVLVPRPETELLVEAAIDLARDRGVESIVDVGTGSGAIAIALARALPHVRLIATDLSEAALQIARANVRRYGLDSRVRCLQGFLLERVTHRPDLVAGNLPYLSDEMMSSVGVDVRHEPREALHAGATGLELYEIMLRQMAERDWPVPAVIEIDPRQGSLVETSVRRIFPRAGVTIERDLAGRDRTVTIEPEAGK